MRPIRRIIIHHSASPRDTTVEQITEWHKARGWDSIGYNLVVTGSGAVRSGRDLRVPGAHAKGANLDSIGVCCTGDNTKPEHAWSEVQILSLRAVVRSLEAAFPGCEVLGHRDVPGAATACPGLDAKELFSGSA